MIKFPTKFTSINTTVFPRTSTLRSLATKPCNSIRLFNEQKSSSKSTPAIIVFDEETTGLSRKYDRIIEFAARDLRGGINSTFETLINPEIHVRNSHVHGITTQMVCNPNVPRFEEVIPKLIKFVDDCEKDRNGVLLVAHNGRRFDVPFLIKEFERYSMEVPLKWLFLDTLTLVKRLMNQDGRKLRSLSLRSLGEHYGIQSEGEHRAMQDVNTLCYVLQSITMDFKLSVDDLLHFAFSASHLSSSSS
ncbi:DNA-directed DNA polymerase protein [Dioscorea alata]|uniref:DNA-directed DNA polymerase protein n=1 Tax=Dioscorea alata TaxID=55571 RepID=A0ACB7VVB1_DIOAL|nr:DNA-directed DNA polymerase protein [Dioscorea alata]